MTRVPGRMRPTGLAAGFALASACLPFEPLECRTDVSIPVEWDEPCLTTITVQQDGASDAPVLVVRIEGAAACADPPPDEPVEVRLPLIPGAEGIALVDGGALVTLAGNVDAPLLTIATPEGVLLLEAGAPADPDDDAALAVRVEERLPASCVSEDGRDISGVAFRADDEEAVIVAGGARTLRFDDVRYAVSVPYAFEDDARYLRWRTDRLP